MKYQASSFEQAQFVATKSTSKRSHRASPSDVENAPRRECMTPEQLKILNPYYEKTPRPLPDDIELLAKEIHRPVQKVVNWFNNRRAKERRLQRQSQKPSPLSQSFSINVDSDADMAEPDVDGSESESDVDQDALDCVAAMDQMSQKEIDVAFILSNLKRRIIIVGPSEQREIDVFSSV
ncbi:uncharacterized protein EDB91DRAFT_1078812 [Suillus paluster]|uniref:uncharacterized protein n=1 Tax=Suillus paluster TaxID=48578 RepID=UPI001B88700E|nr:uncharacterized protein EDB91DRAFT_1078812 [Suillus paluster]KAG1749824.1 hypothetical protein EDB91DRAFT_1078812 [Suillus paluster]